MLRTTETGAVSFNDVTRASWHADSRNAVPSGGGSVRSPCERRRLLEDGASLIALS